MTTQIPMRLMNANERMSADQNARRKPSHIIANAPRASKYVAFPSKNVVPGPVKADRVVCTFCHRHQV